MDKNLGRSMRSRSRTNRRSCGSRAGWSHFSGSQGYMLSLMLLARSIVAEYHQQSFYRRGVWH